MRWAILTLLVYPLVASAHAMLVNWSADAATLTVTVTYDDGEPVSNARVRLFDTAGAEIASGQTDARGILQLPRPSSGIYALKADDGAGHLRTRKLEIKADANDSPPPPDTADRFLTTVVGLVLIALLGCGMLLFLRRKGVSRK